MKIRAKEPLVAQSTRINYVNPGKASTSNSVLNFNSDNKVNTEQIKKNIRADIQNGKLVYKAPIKILGLTLMNGYYRYHPGLTETWDNLKKKYNIPDGVLKKANGLRFEACSMDQRGDYLGSYEINYFKNNGAKIPEKYIKKYVP